jgi:acyl-CoA hydrolase
MLLLKAVEKVTMSEERSTKTPAESRIRLTQLMGPADGNVRGYVHGGFLMKLCDEAGAMAATKHARRPTVTVTVDQMTFRAPVHIGDLVTVDAVVTWVGRTSMETRVTVQAENVMTGEINDTNTAYIVYVGLDRVGRPSPVPDLQLETDEERRLYAEAIERQAFRLMQREQEKSQPESPAK